MSLNHGFYGGGYKSQRGCSVSCASSNLGYRLDYLDIINVATLVN